MRIVILRTDRLGELLLTLPAVAALRRAYPTSQITLVVQQAYAEFVRLHPAVDAVITVAWAHQRARWADVRPLVRTLRAQCFDLAIVAHPHKWLHWAVWRAGIPQRVGYDRKWGWCLTERTPDVKTRMVRHEVEWNLHLLALLGITPAAGEWHVPITEAVRQQVQPRLTALGCASNGRVIALHPWASTPEKQWAPQAFCAVARSAQASGLGDAVIIGGAEHTQEGEVFCREAGQANNLVGALSCLELAVLLAQCRVLVSNDSGPAHVAAAVGTKTVTLFGSPHAWQGPARWRPWGEGHRVLHRVPIQAIRPDEVLQAVREQCQPCHH